MGGSKSKPAEDGFRQEVRAREGSCARGCTTCCVFSLLALKYLPQLAPPTACVADAVANVSLYTIFSPYPPGEKVQLSIRDYTFQRSLFDVVAVSVARSSMLFAAYLVLNWCSPSPRRSRRTTFYLYFTTALMALNAIFLGVKASFFNYVLTPGPEPQWFPPLLLVLNAALVITHVGVAKTFDMLTKRRVRLGASIASPHPSGVSHPDLYALADSYSSMDKGSPGGFFGRGSGAEGALREPLLLGPKQIQAGSDVEQPAPMSTFPDRAGTFTFTPPTSSARETFVTADGVTASPAGATSVSPLGRDGRPTGEVDAEALADQDSRFLQLSRWDARVHYKEFRPRQGVGTAEGEAVVVIHGFAGSVFSWEAVCEELAKSCSTRVVAFDRIGFGLSSRPAKPEGDADTEGDPYSAATQAGVVAELCGALGIAKVSLVAHADASMVALLAAQAALSPPDSTPGPSPRLEVALVAFLHPHLGTGVASKLVEELLKGNVSRRTNKRLLKMEMEVAFRRQCYRPSLITARQMQRYKLLLGVRGWEAALKNVVESSQGQAKREWGAARKLLAGTKVLVVTGAQDSLSTPKLAREFGACVPNSVTRILDDCGHLSQEECPARLVELLSSFVLNFN